MFFLLLLFFFKQKTAYEMRISDWSSDVCSSDLAQAGIEPEAEFHEKKSRALRFATNRPDVSIIRVRAFDVATFVAHGAAQIGIVGSDVLEEFDYSEIYAPVDLDMGHCRLSVAEPRSEEHTSELQSLLRISYAVFCLKKKTII